MTPLLEVVDVTVRREGRLLLDRVSLEVAPAAVHVLVGANGAGKSTLVAAILGQTPFTGRILLHARRDGRVGLVPQRFGVDRALPITVAEFLALARQRWPVCLGVRPRTRRVVDGLLERVGLAGFGGRRLGVLSGGELRRVLVANAIEPAPELLLCDEPASGLDAAAVERVDALFAEVCERAGTAVLLVSHDREEVRRLASRVTLLDGGVARSGTPDELLPMPAGLAAVVAVDTPRWTDTPPSASPTPPAVLPPPRGSR